MKKCIVSALMLLIPFVVSAAGGAGNLDKVYIAVTDQPSLQRGARTFVNYCLSCHNASFMRYERMATDLGISESLLREEMMFASDKPGDLMITAMPDVGAKAWFGVVQIGFTHTCEVSTQMSRPRPGGTTPFSLMLQCHTCCTNGRVYVRQHLKEMGLPMSVACVTNRSCPAP